MARRVTTERHESGQRRLPWPRWTGWKKVELYFFGAASPMKN
jgi:hypothetical protein